MADEPCLVRVEVQSQCPFPIRIMRGDLELVRVADGPID